MGGGWGAGLRGRRTLEGISALRRLQKQEHERQKFKSGLINDGLASVLFYKPVFWFIKKVKIYLLSVSARPEGNTEARLKELWKV